MINKKEVRRYLGIKGTEGGVSDELIDKLCAVVEKRIYPELISGYYDIIRVDGGYKLIGTELVFRGKLIDKVLSECEGIVLFAATLTLEADKLMKEYSAKNMAEAVVLNAVLTTYLEDFADIYEANKKKENQTQGKTIVRRISCGYGDFALEVQADIIKLLNADKYLGIRVNESNMLIPVKSITALIGIKNKTDDQTDKEHCESCVKNCEYRK